MDAWSVDYDLAHYHSNNVDEKSLKNCWWKSHSNPDSLVQFFIFLVIWSDLTKNFAHISKETVHNGRGML